jgi:DNA-binding NarL/FixJ family response regulator
MKIKIVIVEDQLLVTESLKNLIDSQEDMEVIGFTDEASKAPELCRELMPDLVLMDVVTKNKSDGIAASELILRELPEIKIVIMTAYPEISFIDKARKAGIHSYIYKTTGSEHLFYVIRSTMKDIPIYPGQTGKQPFFNLSERELIVVRLACEGNARSKIAEKLEVSEPTIKAEITSILNKTGFDSISQLVAFALSEDFIKPLAKN